MSEAAKLSKEQRANDAWARTNEPRPKTWGDVYWRHKTSGMPPEEAAFRADEWERARKTGVRDALLAVDALWTSNGLDFAEEVQDSSPVGLVWAKVRAALAL